MKDLCEKLRTKTIRMETFAGGMEAIIDEILCDDLGDCFKCSIRSVLAT